MKSRIKDITEELAKITLILFLSKSIPSPKFNYKQKSSPTLHVSSQKSFERIIFKLANHPEQKHSNISIKALLNLFFHLLHHFPPSFPSLVCKIREMRSRAHRERDSESGLTLLLGGALEIEFLTHSPSC